jgi:hypothetical protein
MVVSGQDPEAVIVRRQGSTNMRWLITTLALLSLGAPLSGQTGVEGAALLASYLPARRAAAADSMEALRVD